MVYFALIIAILGAYCFAAAIVLLLHDLNKDGQND